MRRKAFEQHRNKDEWQDWRWQMKNRITTREDLEKVFPHMEEEELKAFEAYQEKYYFALTPYTLSLIELDDNGNPREGDPIWSQFRFYRPHETRGESDYDGKTQNWENPEEFPTAILQHKYPDRGIIRVTNACFSHCNYCYLASRVLDRKTSLHKRNHGEEWEKTLAYLKNHPEIRDVLISGGDPLVLKNESIERILKDLSSIPSVKTLRLNTRVLTFNPYRIDRELVRIFKTYQLTALEIQNVHPREFTRDVDERLKIFDEEGYRPLILWRAPLLNRINADAKVLEELFLSLYERRISAYYLFHYAPFSLGRSVYGLPVEKGAEIMRELRRKIPGAAFPRYTLFHMEGKQDIPLDEGGTREFLYDRDEQGHRIVRFRNWKGNWATYKDTD